MVNNKESHLKPEDERDVVKEGNDIKAKLTKVQPSSHKFAFTSLSQVIIPGINPRKTKPARITQYTPDFLHVSILAQKMFTALRNDREFKGNQQIDEYGNMLYMHYTIIYQILRIINEGDQTTLDTRHCQILLENAGIKSASLPIIFNKYYEGMGTYIDPKSGRTISMQLPKQETTGICHTNYFYSKNTGHLLPNFRATICKAMFLASNSIQSTAIGNRNLRTYRNTLQTGVPGYITPLSLVRNNDTLIPGTRDLRSNLVSLELLELLNPIIEQTEWSSDLHRYLQLSPPLISFLVANYAPIYKMMDHFSVQDFSLTGTDLTLCVALETRDQDVINAEVYTQEILPANGTAPAVIERVEQKLFDHKYKIVVNSSAIDGNAIIATVTPIVRVAAPHNTLYGETGTVVEPNNEWLYRDYEFETPEITLEEALSGFHKV